MVDLLKFTLNWEIMGLVQVTIDVTLKNVTPTNNLLNSYFENPIVGSHFLYILNMHANFHANQM